MGEYKSLLLHLLILLYTRRHTPTEKLSHYIDLYVESDVL
jgi:hypothetical protein